MDNHRLVPPDVGRPPDVSDEELIKVLCSAASPVLTTVEVADEVSIGRHAVHKRLDVLADEGMVVKKRVGNSGTVWWLPRRVE